MWCYYFVFFFKQKTAYELRISDWSSDVCSSDLQLSAQRPRQALEPLVLPVVEALLEALPARSAGELGLAAGHVLEHVGDGLARAGFPHEEYREDAVGVQQRDPDARGLRRGLLVGEAAVQIGRAQV